MEPFIGQLQAFGFNFPPRGWATCDGQLLQISQHSALFSLLGTTYGGDGRTTFALPDLRGRAALHMGSGPGLTTRSIGENLGQEVVPLSANNMPSHSHDATLRAAADGPDSLDPSPAGKVLAAGNIYNTGAASVNMGATAIAVGNTGGSEAHANMQPSLVVNWCIALEGLFPSRS